MSQNSSNTQNHLSEQLVLNDLPALSNLGLPTEQDGSTENRPAASLPPASSQGDSGESAFKRFVDSKIAAYRNAGQRQQPLNFRPSGARNLDIPDGTYRAIADGRFDINWKGTPSYALRFDIFEGEFKGAILWKNLYLTENAFSHSLRFLLELGLNSYEAIRNTVISGTHCEIAVVTKVNSSGERRKEVDSFVVVGGSAPLVSPVCPPPNVPTPPATAAGAAGDEQN